MTAAVILVYVDSAAMLDHCLSVARVVRDRLGARVVLVVVDSERHRPRLTGFEVLDYALLLGPRQAIEAAAGRTRHERVGVPVRRHGSGRMRRAARLALALAIAPLVALRLGARLLPSGADAGMTSLRAAKQTALALPLRLARAARRRLRALAGAVARPVQRLRRLVAARIAAATAGAAIEKLIYWRRATRGVGHLVRALAPDAIILAEDNIETFSRAFVEHGRRCGAPTIVVPFTIPNPKEPATYYADDPRHRVTGPAARLAALLAPKWRHMHEGRAMLRLPVARLAVIEAAGLSTPAPWVLNRGGAAAIALDSDAQRDIYLALGFPPEQLAVVGDAHGAVLARGLAERSERRAALLAGYGLADDRPLVVVAFPPDQFGAPGPDFEHRAFDELVAAWMGALAAAAASANVIVRPHPRLDAARLAPFATQRLRISAAPTVEMVPLADLYVASISATIRWAIACGVPVLDYDCYRYRYGDYASADGVVHLENEAAFRAALGRFLRDAAWRTELGRRQARVAGHWGLVDEGAADRLADLVARHAMAGARRRGRATPGTLAASAGLQRDAGTAGAPGVATVTAIEGGNR